jgi:hypothetical protein
MNRSARAEVIEEVSRWSVGTGILITVLAPLAIPILVLTVVFIAPLLILPLVAALPVALVVGAVRATRAIGRRLGRPTRSASQADHPATMTPRRS